MAEFISRKSLPAPTRGRGSSSDPSLSISEMGGVRVNKMVLDKCKDALGLHLAWDKETRKVTFTAVNLLPKGVSQEDLFEINSASKNSQGAIGGMAGFLRMQAYDFKTSGNQNFPLTVAEVNAGYQFSFILPSGALTPKPKAPRAPRAPKAAKANGAPAAIANVEQSVADLV